MTLRTSNLFLLLVIFQGFHSIEEYIGKLWEVFPPAIWLTERISSNSHFGFLVINIGIFVFGILFWIFVVKTKHEKASLIIWIWVVLELLNGIGHTVWSMMQQEYTPGMITAPLLFVTASLLLWRMVRKDQSRIV